MRKIISVVLLACLLMMGLAGTVSATPDTASTGVSRGQEVCEGFDSEKIDVVGNQKSVTVTALEGKLIDGYCVKAGSDQSVEDGAVQFIAVSPPAESVTITHPSGKDVSHYALSYTDKPVELCPEGTKYEGTPVSDVDDCDPDDTPPEKPADLVDVDDGEWVDGEFKCDDTTVKQTREVTTTTTTYALVDNEWVLDTDNAVVENSTEERVRDLTEDEVVNCTPENVYRVEEQCFDNGLIALHVYVESGMVTVVSGEGSENYGYPQEPAALIVEPGETVTINGETYAVVLESCGPEEPVIPEPTEPTEPVEPQEPVDTPDEPVTPDDDDNAVTIADVPDREVERAGTLPVTGNNTWLLTLLGLVLLGAGGYAVRRA